MPLVYEMGNENLPTSQAENKITANYELKNNTLSFAIENYDQLKTLVIDPALIWSTYYGGSNGEYGYEASADGLGNVYLTGSTSSISEIASGGHQNIYAGISDAFLVKFHSDGFRLWGTYYGGTNEDHGQGVSADGSGNVYLAGTTSSFFVIAFGGHQNSKGGMEDAYLVKFNTAGVRQWATYYGGTGTEYGNGVCTDGSGNVYLSGFTASTTAIAFGGHQNIGGGGDAFLVKFDSAGVRQWGTYYGGSNFSYGDRVSTDGSENVYLVGYTASTDSITTVGSHQSIFGGGTCDAFLVKFNSAGVREWGTYYGGTIYDYGYGVSTDGSGNVFLGGYTYSTNAIASGGHQNSIGGVQDAFLVKFNSAGVREWGTYYGGTGDDYGYGVCVDGSENVYLTGYTSSMNAISTISTFGGGSVDAFLVKFNSVGIREWGTYCGGTGYDRAQEVSADGSGNIYLAGYTYSTGMVYGGYQTIFGGVNDAFLIKLNDSPLSITTGTISGSSFCAGDNINIPYTITGTFNAGNVFTSQLSDASGSFASPVSIGTLSSISSGIISATIPPGTAFGTGYRIRVVSLNPVVTGTDNGTNLTVNQNLPVSVSISASNTTICSGTNVTFTATHTNGGSSPNYQWQVNGVNVGINSSSYSTTTLSNNDVVTCVLTSNAVPCAIGNPATSNSVIMTVNPNLPVSVSILASNTTICQGDNVNFTATPTNGGSSPSYQWQVNGVNVGTNNSAYSSSSLTNNDVVTCVLTSNVVCPLGNPATSNSVTMTVSANLPVSINISASNTNVCSGTNVIFTATPTNGGSTPSYQWQINGVNVGINNSSYSSSSLTNNDVVTCILTSNANCATGNPAASNSITMTVNPNLPVSISISANDTTICLQDNVIFTATPTNGGSAPSYQWQVNGVNVGTNSNTYSSSTLANNDVVTCILTSNVACPSGNPATSNVVTITVSSPPTIADAGINQTICSNTTTMAANIPTIGTGMWTTISGSGSFTSASSPASNLNLIGIGTNIFRWTISNEVCPSSFDDVIITRNQPSSSSMNVTACDSYSLNSQVYNTSGTYTQTLTNVVGCDSTIRAIAL